MRKSVKIVLSLCCIFLFFLIRIWETKLFYDPLIDYFRNDFLHKKIEDMDRWRLIIHMVYRYVLNATISLGLIWILFKRTDYVKFSAIFFFLAMLILIFVFVILLQDDLQGGYLLLFYVRRFIIHPILILLLLTVFYYQKLIPS